MYTAIATDAAGNASGASAGPSVSIDTQAPDTSIASGPTGATRNASPAFELSSSESGSTFTCRLDGPGAAIGSNQSCSTPMAYGSLADGSYTFSVTARDATGNVDATPASRASPSTRWRRRRR